MTEHTDRGNPLGRWPLSDYGNAQRLIDRYGEQFIHVPGVDWHLWDGKRWRRDPSGGVARYAKQSARHLLTAASKRGDKELVTFALRSESGPSIRHAIELARTEDDITVEVAQLDADPFLLNVNNGTIDLRTGELREHDPADLISNLAPADYDPDARSDLWDACLRSWTGDDAELIGFLQRAVGYSLTGSVSEEKLFFVHGPTASGKSTFALAVQGLLGRDRGYARVADFATFLRSDTDRSIRSDIARLAGARCVFSSEVQEGRRLAEGTVKTMTGGDPMAARLLYKNEFEFMFTGKLWLIANDKPSADGQDDALWRRILLVPFECTIPPDERDGSVKKRLQRDEDVRSAVLAWAVEGCLQWQRDGLKPPERVIASTEAYRAENNPIAAWVEADVIFEPDAVTSKSDVEESYAQWADENGQLPQSPRAITIELQRHGCEQRKSSGTRYWHGVRLAEPLSPRKQTNVVKFRSRRNASS